MAADMNNHLFARTDYRTANREGLPAQIFHRLQKMQHITFETTICFICGRIISSAGLQEHRRFSYRCRKQQEAFSLQSVGGCETPRSDIGTPRSETECMVYEYIASLQRVSFAVSQPQMRTCSIYCGLPTARNLLHGLAILSGTDLYCWCQRIHAYLNCVLSLLSFQELRRFWVGPLTLAHVTAIAAVAVDHFPAGIRICMHGSLVHCRGRRGNVYFPASCAIPIEISVFADTSMVMYAYEML